MTELSRLFQLTRSTLMLWLCVLGTIQCLCAAPVMAESARFDIAVQPLPAALKEFAAQSHMQLLYEHKAVEGVNCNAVRGELDKKAALEQLIRGTGLVAVYSSSGDAFIRPAEVRAQGDQTANTQIQEAEKRRSAQAHRAPYKSAKADDSEKSLGELIVIARRREETVQTVPIAVSVVSQQVLEENNVQTLGDLQYLVPSMSASAVLTRDAWNLTIRGQGTNGFSGLPGVIGYLNEVPIPADKDGNLTGGLGLLFDLENVQVLKGPQGTLFGRNSVGGAILLQSVRPKKEFGGRMQLTYGNFNNRELDAVVNLPIVEEKLMARIAVNGQLRDGFTRVLGMPGDPNGVDADGRTYWGARGTLNFRPTESFGNELILTYSDYDSSGSPAILTDLNPNGIAALIFPELVTLFAEQQALGKRRTIPVSVRLESQGSNLTLINISRLELTGTLAFRNIFGFAKTNTVYACDLDNTELPLLDAPSTPRDQNIHQYSNEAQVLGKSFSGLLDWIIGGFFLEQKRPKFYVLQTGETLGLPRDSEYQQGDRSRALFGQGTYDLSALLDGLKFTIGVRYTWDDRTHNDRGGHLGSSCVEPRSLCDEIIRRKFEDGAMTWTVGLDYRPAPGTLLYLTSRRGYRTGGSNTAPFNGEILKFDPEYVVDVEAGIKRDWDTANVAIRTNAAIYYQDVRDMQVSRTVIDNVNVPQLITSNAAAAELWGAEFEALIRLTDDLDLGANLSYGGLNYKSFGTGVDGVQLNATRTGRAIPWTYGANLRYHLPLSPQAGDISVKVNWSWQDESRIGPDLSRNDGGVIPAFGLLNADLSWEDIGGRSIDASFYVSNLTDKIYSVAGFSAFNSFGIVSNRFGIPRMYGLRLRYRFGE